jgi:hypothetical protein
VKATAQITAKLNFIRIQPPLLVFQSKTGPERDFTGTE